LNLENQCSIKKGFCVNCHSEFMRVRPYLKSVVISKHFVKDCKTEEEAKSIIQKVLDCSDLEFTELHKFEENIDGNLIFRAKKEGTHIVYCVDKSMQIIFLRAIRNFNEYKRFLDDRKQIKKIIAKLG
jgi:mRNA-degrading endonuclease RelE of RelBE toxin-antitoxin system